MIMAAFLRITFTAMIVLPALVQATEHPCKRPCTWPPTPMTCRYTFTIEWLDSMSSACFNCPSNLTDCSLPGCIPMNGVRRPVVSVNQQIPGPPIEVCEDDYVVVKVWNELGNSEGTSIHWHAIHHRDTPYMDGATMITQCPISAKSSFTYKFKASPGGSHWYHGHSQFQRLDGLYGSLIIKQAPERNIHSALYNYDLPEHVLFVQGWTNEAASPLGTANVKSFIINGKGRFDPMLNIPREVFKVKQGEKYRFRLLANNACHVHLRVQSHNITVIATDASPIQPIVVDSIGFSSGERYDFVLTADQPVDNYWFRIEYVSGSVCRDAIPTEYAILRYEGAADEEPQQEFDAEDGVLLNPPTIDTGPNSINLLDLNSAVPDNPRLLGEPDNRLYLSVRKHDVTPFNFYNSVDYPNPQISRAPYTIATINNNFFKLPSSPLLTQMNDIPKDDFCTTDEALARKGTCFEEFCMCIQVAKIGLNETVELVIVSERGNHPMHLHGHFVQFVGQGQLYPGVTLEDVKQMDERGEIPRKLGGGILRDTFRTEKEGYTIVRFIADNPGQWFFHCHDIYHSIDGMEMVFQVGEMSDLPPIPKGFPRCGSWSPEDDVSEEDDKGRKDGATAPARDEKKLRKQL